MGGGGPPLAVGVRGRLLVVDVYPPLPVGVRVAGAPLRAPHGLVVDAVFGVVAAQLVPELGDPAAHLVHRQPARPDGRHVVRSGARRRERVPLAAAGAGAAIERREAHGALLLQLHAAATRHHLHPRPDLAGVCRRRGRRLLGRSGWCPAWAHAFAKPWLGVKESESQLRLVRSVAAVGWRRRAQPRGEAPDRLLGHDRLLPRGAVGLLVEVVPAGSSAAPLDGPPLTGERGRQAWIIGRSRRLVVQGEDATHGLVQRLDVRSETVRQGAGAADLGRGAADLGHSAAGGQAGAVRAGPLRTQHTGGGDGVSATERVGCRESASFWRRALAF